MKRPQSLRVRDAAKSLGVSIKFVYDLIWAGKLEAEKVGKTWHIPASAIEARLKQRGA
jgi:excisionase family DNA binding protein